MMRCGEMVRYAPDHHVTVRRQIIVGAPPVGWVFVPAKRNDDLNPDTPPERTHEEASRHLEATRGKLREQVRAMEEAIADSERRRDTAEQGHLSDLRREVQEGAQDGHRDPSTLPPEQIEGDGPP